MRIKKGFVLREIAGEKIVSGEGIEQIDFNKIFVLNTSAVYVFENIVGKEFDVAFVADLLMSKYEVEKNTAEKDAALIVSRFIKEGFLEE